MGSPNTKTREHHGKDARQSPAEIELRFSYCEINANGSNQLHLGAGAPEVILSLPDELTNIRLVMIEPSERALAASLLVQPEINEAGKLLTYVSVRQQ